MLNIIKIMEPYFPYIGIVSILFLLWIISQLLVIEGVIKFGTDQYTRFYRKLSPEDKLKELEKSILALKNSAPEHLARQERILKEYMAEYIILKKYIEGANRHNT